MLLKTAIQSRVKQQASVCCEKGRAGARNALALRNRATQQSAWPAFEQFDHHADHYFINHEPTAEQFATARVMTKRATASLGMFSMQNAFDVRAMRGNRSKIAEISEINFVQNGEQYLPQLWHHITEKLMHSGVEFIFISVKVDENFTCPVPAKPITKAPEELRCAPKNSYSKPLVTRGATLMHSDPTLNFFLDQGAMVCGEPNWENNMLEYCLVTRIAAHI